MTERREKGSVVEIGPRIVFGTAAAVLAASGPSKVSRAINTAFIERENGTDRHRDARKARETDRFSKEWRRYEASAYLSIYCYNFRRPVRTLSVTDAEGRREKRSPTMAAGLADRSRLVDVRMVVTTSRAMILSHEANRGISRNYSVRAGSYGAALSIRCSTSPTKAVMNPSAGPPTDPASFGKIGRSTWTLNMAGR